MSRLTRLKDVGSSTLFDRQYSYNAANQISQITEAAQTRIFGYDNLDRLTSVTNAANGNESYSFDAVGNRTASHKSASYGYEAFNRLTSTASTSYVYDANGAIRSKFEAGQFWRFAWDYENRITSAANRKQSVRYVYDALGRRVMRQGKGAAGATVKYTYDGADVILDDDSVQGQVKYLNGLGIDNKLRQTINNQAQYFLSDHLGSTNGLADNSGNLISSTNYDAFGNQSGNLTTRYGFTGRERDYFTGLMYYRNGWYSSELGEFVKTCKSLYLERRKAQPF
jgi:YD repeat-containing protein